MKKIMLSALAFAIVAAAPAHAINAKYREQLIRSGCTQVTEGVTCDITKTKAQNAANAGKPLPKPTPKPATAYGQIVGEAENILGLKTVAAEEYLVQRGWRQQSNGDWGKSGHLLRIVEDKGFVRNAQIVK